MSDFSQNMSDEEFDRWVEETFNKPFEDDVKEPDPELQRLFDELDAEFGPLDPYAIPPLPDFDPTEASNVPVAGLPQAIPILPDIPIASLPQAIPLDVEPPDAPNSVRHAIQLPVEDFSLEEPIGGFTSRDNDDVSSLVDQSSWFPMPDNSDPSTPADQSSWVPMGADPSAGMADADDSNDQTFDTILGASGSTGGAAGTDSNWSTLFDKLDKIIAILEKGSTSSGKGSRSSTMPGQGQSDNGSNEKGLSASMSDLLIDQATKGGGFVDKAVNLLAKTGMKALMAGS